MRVGISKRESVYFYLRHNPTNAFTGDREKKLKLYEDVKYPDFYNFILLSKTINLFYKVYFQDECMKCSMIFYAFGYLKIQSQISSGKS